MDNQLLIQCVDANGGNDLSCPHGRDPENLPAAMLARISGLCQSPECKGCGMISWRSL
jgi:hypothetical protein